MSNKVRLVCFNKNNLRMFSKIILLSNFSLRVVLCLVAVILYYVTFDYEGQLSQKLIRFIEVFLLITPVSLFVLLLVNLTLFYLNKEKEVCLHDLSLSFKRKKMSGVLRANKNIFVLRIGRFKSYLFYYENEKELDEIQNRFINLVNSKD